MPSCFKSALQSCVALVIFLLTLFSTFSSASPLKVGVYPCPPFVISLSRPEMCLHIEDELWLLQ
ncbi:ABC transporter substrate-binding protein, partial [Vibrio splendidus]